MSTITDTRTAAVGEVLDAARAEGRTALSAPEAKRVCDAYGIDVPGEGLATSADEAVSLAQDIGLPVVLKIVSPDILHKTEAKGVLVGLDSAEAVSKGYDTIIANARAYKSDADITGVQVQQMLSEGQEVLIGAVTDPTFGPVMTFGIGGVLVEVLRDVTFRLAPTSAEDALGMVDGIRAAEVLRGVRGAEGVDRDALARMIQAVSSSSPTSRRSSRSTSTRCWHGPTGRPRSTRASSSPSRSARRRRRATARKRSSRS